MNEWEEDKMWELENELINEMISSNDLSGDFDVEIADRDRGTDRDRDKDPTPMDISGDTSGETSRETKADLIHEYASIITNIPCLKLSLSPVVPDPGPWNNLVERKVATLLLDKSIPDEHARYYINNFFYIEFHNILKRISQPINQECYAVNLLVGCTKCDFVMAWVILWCVRRIALRYNDSRHLPQELLLEASLISLDDIHIDRDDMFLFLGTKKSVYLCMAISLSIRAWKHKISFMDMLRPYLLPDWLHDPLVNLVFHAGH